MKNLSIKTAFVGAKTVCSASLVSLLLLAGNAHAIQKCQDADGKWHYGDVAIEECKASKVTTLNERGFIKGQEAAPKTKEQIEAEQETFDLIEAKRIAIEKDKLERERILSVYQSEADIDRQLDNQIYSVNSSIAVHRVYLQGMADKVERLEAKKAGLKAGRLTRTQGEIDSSKVKIAEFEKELKGLEQQKADIQTRFAREKELYRTLKEELESASE